MLDLTTVEASDITMRIPAMLKPHERKLLYHLGSLMANKDGFVIDAGCFTGGSTVALAEGIYSTEEPPRSGHIIAYDHFKAENIGARFIKKQHGDDLKPGESFRYLFDQQTAPYDGLIEVRESDIFKEQWNASNPIDILFIDIAKSSKLNFHVMKTFYGALRPGSFLIHQEFFWWLNPTVPITTLLLKDHFDVYAKAPPSGAFVLTKPISDLDVDAAIQKFYDPAISFPLMEEAINMAPSDNAKIQLNFSKARLISELVGIEEARDFFDGISDRFPQYPWVDDLQKRVSHALDLKI